MNPISDSGLTSLSASLENAYTVLIDATRKAFDASEAVHDAKEALKSERDAILIANAAEPKALGSNEAAREATINQLCAARLANLKAAELNDRAAAHAQAIAKLDVDATRAQLRILEVAVAARPGVRS